MKAGHFKPVNILHGVHSTLSTSGPASNRRSNRLVTIFLVKSPNLHLQFQKIVICFEGYYVALGSELSAARGV